MFSAPSRATAAALYRRVEEESNEFSSRLTTHAANSNMSLNRYEPTQFKNIISCSPKSHLYSYGLRSNFYFVMLLK